jgi:VWFA-related protein
MPVLSRGLPAFSSSGLEAFSGTASAEKEFRETTALLSRSQVAVYPIDARGLATISNFNAANHATSTGLSGRQGPASTTLEKDLLAAGNENADENSTMYVMAGDTGGRAAVNTNGLRQAVEDAIDDGSNYYTIAYSPTDANWNGTFRHIQVKLKEHGYNLSYRKGYFADDPDAPGNAKGDLASAAASVSADARRAGADAAHVHRAGFARQRLYRRVARTRQQDGKRR